MRCRGTNRGDQSVTFRSTPAANGGPSGQSTIHFVRARRRTMALPSIRGRMPPRPSNPGELCDTRQTQKATRQTQRTAGYPCRRHTLAQSRLRGHTGRRTHPRPRQSPATAASLALHRRAVPQVATLRCFVHPARHPVSAYCGRDQAPTSIGIPQSTKTSLQTR